MILFDLFTVQLIAWTLLHCIHSAYSSPNSFTSVHFIFCALFHLSFRLVSYMAATAMLQLGFAALSWSSNNTVLQWFPVAVPRELLYTRSNAIIWTKFDSSRVMCKAHCPDKWQLSWVAVVLGGIWPGDCSAGTILEILAALGLKKNVSWCFCQWVFSKTLVKNVRTFTLIPLNVVLSSYATVLKTLPQKKNFNHLPENGLCTF